jgi:uncharacterized hydrophobic protein (TIGR00271 family)
MIVIDQDELIGPDLRWPIRIAKLKDTTVVLLVCAPQNAGKEQAGSGLSGSDGQSPSKKDAAERIGRVLDEYLGSGQWTGEGPMLSRATGTAGAGGELKQTRVVLRFIAGNRAAEEVKKMALGRRIDLTILVGRNAPERRRGWQSTLELLLKSVESPVVVVVPGAREDGGELLAAAGRGAHGRTAIDLAGELAAGHERKLTGLYVEPDIGPDAEGVGRRVLGRRLKGRKIPPDAARRVVIDKDPAKGILDVCGEEQFECLVFGASRIGALGGSPARSVPNRVLQSKPAATLIAVRRALPISTQLSRRLEAVARRFMPQILREDRIDLVERIQSNSMWNFDFNLLMLLSTIIATLGLIDNSAAVIIGAMLVAPLMTPILGIGLAIAQGNLRLARIALKALSLGFLMAFGIALAIGFLTGEFFELTDQMRSRDWPQILDLVIAFVSGMAAAYAWGRPRLLAALPGVAIAAALLPPVATAALAITVGRYDTALGALLLFGINMVAISIAGAVVFWAVGIRDKAMGTGRTRWLRYALIVVTIAIITVIAFSPPIHAPSKKLVQAVESELGDEFRLRNVGFRRATGTLNQYLQVDVGGSRLPDADLKERLLEIVQKHAGEKVGLRMTFQYEDVVR